MLTSDSALAFSPAPGQGRLWHSAFANSPQKTLGLSSVAVTHKFQAFLPLSGHLPALGGGNSSCLGQNPGESSATPEFPSLRAHSPAGPAVRARGQLLPVLSNDCTVEGKANRPAPINYSFMTEARSLSVMFVSHLPH